MYVIKISQNTSVSLISRSELVYISFRFRLLLNTKIAITSTSEKWSGHGQTGQTTDYGLGTALVQQKLRPNRGQFKFELVSNLIYVGAMCPLCSVQQTDQTWHFQIKYKSDNVSDHFYTKIKVPCVIHS